MLFCGGKTAIIIQHNKYFLLSSIVCFSFSISNVSNKAYADHSISVTSSGAQEINASPDPGHSTSIGVDNISVSTTCKLGYNFTLSTSVDNNNLYLDGNISNNSPGTYFSPSNGSTALVNATNTWGYYYNSNSPTTAPTSDNIFNAVPASGSTPAVIKSPLDTPSSTDITDAFNIYYGVAVGLSLAPGSYQMIPDTNNSNADGTIVYQATMANACLLYTVYFNPTSTAGGNTLSGTGTMNPQPISVGTATNLSSASFTPPTGYEFDSWNTAQNGTGTSYSDGQSVTDLAPGGNSITLYAQWKESGPCNPSGTTITTIGCMQDFNDGNMFSIAESMTQGQQYQLYDNRDNQQYWVAKQADGNIWMTQNLDLCVGCTGVATLTSNNTDLNISGSVPYIDGYTNSGGVITWTPASTAKTSDYTLSGNTVSPSIGTTNNVPYSVEGGDRYYYTSGSTSTDTVKTLEQCVEAGHSEGDCKHYHAGNYYTWTEAIASNDTSEYQSSSSAKINNAANSLCPKGWKLPGTRKRQYVSRNTSLVGYLWQKAGAINKLISPAFVTDGFNNIRTSPLYFVRAGSVSNRTLSGGGTQSYYWGSSFGSTTLAFWYGFTSSQVKNDNSDYRYYAQPVRCMVKTRQPTLYDYVADQSISTQGVNAIRASFDLPDETNPVSTNSGVYGYYESVYGNHSDASTAEQVYYYRGILDSYGHTGTYGSDGDNDAFPNTVVLSSASSKSGLTTSDTCWRIVRTTGSGGVKIIYQGKWTAAGTSGTCKNTDTNADAISSVYFNRRSTSSSNSYGTNGRIIYAGYNRSSTSSHQTGTSAIANSTLFVNGTASNLRTQLENWYNNNMTTWTSKLEGSAGWCSDRTTYSGDTTDTKTTSTIPYKSSSALVNFGSYIRILTTDSHPTLGCPNDTGYDLLTTANGYLGVPSAPLTADEIVFAGAGTNVVYATTDNTYLNSGGTSWLLSPKGRVANSYVYVYTLSANSSASDIVSQTHGVRPSISLKDGTIPVSGTGTTADPWIVNP